jgi:hypothetical protein
MENQRQFKNILSVLFLRRSLSCIFKVKCKDKIN